MDITKKVITKLPLDALWNEAGDLNAERIASALGAGEVAEVVKAGATFVVADIGLVPRWIDAADRFEFWKTEVKPRLAEGPAFLERFADGYCYFASKWRLADQLPVIVLEKHH